MRGRAIASRWRCSKRRQIYVSQEVWDEVDDMSDVLRKMEEDGIKPEIEARGRKRAKKSD